MFEPISLTAFACAGLGAYSRASSALSKDAKLTDRAVSAIVSSCEESVALYGERSLVHSSLIEMAVECSQADWDGNGAYPINIESLRLARSFLDALPVGFSMPECAPEPDGSISLEWVMSRYSRFSISIGNTDRLSYAWLDGTDKGHGVARFDGIILPKHILAALSNILHNEQFNVSVA